MTDRLLTIAELADYLGLSESTIYQRRYRGADLPPAITLSGHARAFVRYRLSDVERWLEEHADKPAV